MKEMITKKTICFFGVTTCMMITPVGFYGNVQAEQTQPSQVLQEKDTFRTGNLTSPSSKSPEDIVKDALQAKINQKLSLQQINTEPDVDYQVIQKRKAYDGTTLIRVQQMYKGKEIYGHQLTAHVDPNGVIQSISGDSAQNLTTQEALNQQISLSPGQAKQFIYTKYGSNVEFITTPQIKQIIYVDKKSGQAVQAYLVKFAVSTPEYVSGTYILHAINGEILRDMVKKSNVKIKKEIINKLKNNQRNQVPFTNLTGKGRDDTGVSRTFGIFKQADGQYAMGDYTRGEGIETYDVNYKDLSTEWESYPGNLASSRSTTFQDSKAVSAHFLASKVYDFYKDKYKRNGFDNNGQKVISVVHAWDSQQTDNPKNWRNAASIDGNMLVYGDPLVKAFDVAGHEFTHAITSNESNLEYYGESGAINEAISDVLGVSIEKYINKGKFNWTMGEQSGETFRDMKKPSAIPSPFGIPYPEDYSQYNEFGGEDNGGVHYNSSIINKAAYLLAKGGTHNGVNVKGIGEDKMFDIFFYANTDELNMTSTFYELKQACIQVASQKYGASSREVQAVQQAFDAVYIY